MTIITHLAQRPRKKNTGTLRPKRGSAKRSEFGKPLPPSGNPGPKRTGFSISREYFDNLPRPKTDTSPRLLCSIDQNFQLLFKLLDCICGVNLKSQISNLLTGLSCCASKLNTETGSPARPTRIVEKLTVKLDAQQLSAFKLI